MKNKKNVLIILSIVAFIIVIGGISFSFFVYNKNLGDVSVNTGEISINYSDVNGNMSLTGIIPKSDNEGKISTDYIDFTVDGIVDTDKIYYELSIVPNSGNTLDTQYIKVYLTDQEDNVIKGVTAYDSLQVNEKENGKRIYRETIDPNQDGTKKTYSKDFRLRVWLDENYSDSTTKTFEFNVNLFAKNIENDYIVPTGENLVKRAIVAKQNAEINLCNPVFIDDNGTTNDESDDIIYFSGTNDCVDMNYVWYSGKIWRITAIYPDGSMKLITEDTITSIFWGSDIEYDGSWVYQWLNEDFYDTLVNPSSIIESTSIWNYSTDGNSTPVRPETIATQKTKKASVGLLNFYEFYNSYRCIDSADCTASYSRTSYLNIGYNWWLITPHSTSDMRGFDCNGILVSFSPSIYAFVVRPSINLKSGLEFTGDGSKSNPYKIIGDKEDIVNNTTLLSNRSIGEYVKFDNDLYRIVDTTGGITKLTRVDYLRDNGTVITKNPASTVYFGKSTNTQTDTYWDYYLNNTWYNNISSTYKSMLVDGIYYLGFYPNNTNYKATICKDVDLNSVTTKTCIKYTSSDTDKTWTGKVGLQRIGEMFSSQLDGGSSTSGYAWLITPSSISSARIVRNTGDINDSSALYGAYGARPSINLKPGIKITGGTGYVGGDTNSPFEISE